MAFTIRYEVSHFYPPYLLFFMMGFWFKIFFANLKLSGLTYQVYGKVMHLETKFSNVDGTWGQQFLIPLPLYHPVFTIVIYG